MQNCLMALATKMANLRRAIVGLKCHEHSETVIPAKFLDCIVNYFSPNEISGKVGCKLQNNMLVLYPAKKQVFSKRTDMLSEPTYIDMSSVIIQHSPECPILLLPEEERLQLSNKFQDQGVYVGVSVILESSDNKVLLTQRADHMRAFPRVWVPPGGHLEYGESLTEGAFRELREETGLNFDLIKPKIKLLCLWESVYPVVLGFGAPKNHHVVVYFHLLANETWDQMQKRMQLDAEEVQACTWLNEENIKSLFERSGFSSVTKFSLTANGEVKQISLDIEKMFHPTLWQERKIYSGTQLALHRWLMFSQRRREMINKM